MSKDLNILKEIEDKLDSLTQRERERVVDWLYDKYIDEVENKKDEQNLCPYKWIPPYINYPITINPEPCAPWKITWWSNKTDGTYVFSDSSQMQDFAIGN